MKQSSVVSENLAHKDFREMDIPETIQKIGSDAMYSIWQLANHTLQQELTKLQKNYDKAEQQYQHEYQKLQAECDQKNKIITALKHELTAEQQENRAMQVDLEQKTGEITSNQAHIGRLEEKAIVQEHENRNMLEESARAREAAEFLKKQLDECNRQSSLSQHSLDKCQEEMASIARLKDRLQDQAHNLGQETEELRERLKIEFSKTKVAEAVLEENRNNTRKIEKALQDNKAECQFQKESLHSEQKSRAEFEKKSIMLSTQLDAQSTVHRDMVTKLEQELALHKSETMTLRSRMIKTEGALEREKKAVERLEAKLSGAKSSTHH
ncbi:coiled-coil domain-containing protein [Candidatus Venteria ishoeyi]|uniref:Chromosome partition protein Smc n=1 Tax=Candidatus Venteria ishoeyi TaxID=1899563 RepID=A0A1H6FBS4_9GAMM|nr:hypothetical protein [Candidatus Venteria ishoeyi]SEH07528.1 Chromosome partition protein Smc [Candidatus Venteria ishoeyi]